MGEVDRHSFRVRSREVSLRGVSLGNKALRVSARIVNGVTHYTTLRISNISRVSYNGRGGGIGSLLRTTDVRPTIAIRVQSNATRLALGLIITFNTHVPTITRGMRRGIGATIRGVAGIAIDHIGLIVTNITTRRRRWNREGAVRGVLPHHRTHRGTFLLTFSRAFNSIPLQRTLLGGARSRRRPISIFNGQLLGTCCSRSTRISSLVDDRLHG